jgi:CubicO group peptidase (beta-lactamase class C family)
MRTLKSKGLITIILMLIGVVIGNCGYIKSSTPVTGPPGKDDTSKLAVKKNDIPIQGAITHVCEPDNSSKTIINIVIGKKFTGTLPDDIDTITVAGPNGDLTFGKSDFNYFPRFRYFWIRIPGTPETGTYTFTVTSGNRSGSATDTQLDVRTIPIPDTRTFSPTVGETITTKSPQFSWRAINADLPLYYRIDIKDMTDNIVFRTGYGKNMISTRVPPNLLKAGQTYRWRVRVADGNNWIVLNNRSHNQWQTVTVVPTQGESEYRYQVPIETDDGWVTSSLREESVDPEKISELMRNILNGNEEVKNVHSVLLVKNGKLVLEEYFYGNHRNGLHRIASDTKSVTSILVGIAVDRKLLYDLNQMLYDFFPEYKGTQWIDQKYEITLKHALTMTSGLDWDELTYPYWDARNSSVKFERSGSWIEYILNRETKESPGKTFTYNSGLSILLGEIIRKSTGMYADKFAEQYLFGPLGISEYDWLRHDDGTIHSGGGLRLRPRDMAKIGYMMLKNGNWKGKQIVSQKWAQESTKAQVSAGLYGYGYQWWSGKTIANNQIIDSYWARGLGGQFIFVFPVMDLVVVFNGKVRKNPGNAKRTFNMLTKYIIPAVMPPGPPREIAEVDVKVLKTYVGTYKFEHNGETETVNIILKDNRLYGHGDGEEQAELFPVSESQFIGTLKDIGSFKLKFVKNQKGNITQFILHLASQFAYVSIPFNKPK